MTAMLAMAPSPGPAADLLLPDEAATRRLAAALAGLCRPGDVVTLSGDLGAGKTTFARALIRALAGDDRLEVPSPTFTLMQVYDLPRLAVVHADLYRIEDPADLAELGWDEAQEGALLLVEWPEKAGTMLDGERLDVALALAPDREPLARRVTLTAHGGWAERLGRFVAAREMLDAAGWGAATRRHLQGDASTRAYERLTLGDRTAILMNAPRRPDGPPVRDGKPYSAIAHLAEDVRPFVAMAEGLRQLGFSAPAILASDLGRGFLLLEDLGTEGVVAGDPPTPVESRYAVAVDVLADLHSQSLPSRLPVVPGLVHDIPPYDRAAFLIEAELLADWYLPHVGRPIPASFRSEFLALWSEALAEPLAAPRTWVLRDYHSPNLMWLPDREGVRQVGLLDFQDALMGPCAYDVVSLLQDARVTVPERLEITLLGRYVAARRAADPAFDAAAFARQYAVLGAQRATKILGIFARLHKRDGKPGYLRHLPRVHGYLARCLAHPVLHRLAVWYEAHVPKPTP